MKPYPGPGARRQVSTNGAGGVPTWRHDGGAIFYIASNRDLMEVAVKVQGSGLELSPPSKMFGPIMGVGGHNYDVTQEGRILTFATNARVEENLTLVTNWLSLIKKP